MPRLFVLSGQDVGSVLAFDGTVVIGRDKVADLVVHAASVSRRHARLEPRGERWFVVDLGSSNGTHVGGARVTEAELVDGELFRIGELELRFRSKLVEGARPAPSPAPATSPAVPAPAPPPPAAAAPASAADTGEIMLEGEWEDVPLPAARPIPAPAVASRPAAAGAAPSVRASEPTAAQAARLEAARVSAAARGERATASGGRVLQYRKLERRSGLFSTDFEQQPGWVRWSLLVLLVVLTVALAWGGFELTRSLRERGDHAGLESGD